MSNCNKQIIIDEVKINPNDWLEPYKPIPACEIKDCEHWVYAGNNVYGCRIAEDGLVCDDFNNDDECCMYRQLEYYKEALKTKEQECERLNNIINEAKNSKLDLNSFFAIEATVGEYQLELDQLKAENDKLKVRNREYMNGNIGYQLKNSLYKQTLAEIKEIASKVLLNTHDLEQFKDADALFGTLLEIHKKISEVENEKALRVFNL